MLGFGIEMPFFQKMTEKEFKNLFFTFFPLD